MIKKQTLGLLLTTVMMWSAAKAEESPIVDISGSWDLKHWKEKAFADETDYAIVDLESRQVLKATTDNSASVLYKKINIDLTKTPFLNWSWRVDNTYSNLDPLSKNGDDFPARVYVVFNKGFLPWSALSLNYVWANSEEKDDYWPNPFTDQAMMIPVQSGSDGLGEWQHYKKDIRSDFKRTFNKDISKIHGVAIMADSDNAMQKAVSYFDNIHFSAN